MDFFIPDYLVELKEKTRSFVIEKVLPMESDYRQTTHGPTDELRQELMAMAKDKGLLTPHASLKMGGLALSHFAKAIVFEEAGYSLLGPVALNIHAPDEGNIHLLETVATPDQQEQWLRPLVQGRIRSCFAMTEPAPGAGSDPSMLTTTATKDGDDYLINGTKWLITGADGADFAIIMARMEDDTATMFITDMNRTGLIHERQLSSLDSCFVGGHAVLRFDNLRIPSKDTLGEVGKGFKYAQVRLAPARLTHCMRWLGAARRAHDIACEYVRNRSSFGSPLGEHQGVGFMLADNLMDLHSVRLAIWHCAWVLDQGGRGNVESSLTKVISSEALWRVVDRSMQVLGGLGITGDTVVEKIFRDMRPFRIYDGPSEVHRMSLAKKILSGQLGEQDAKRNSQTI